MCRNSKPKFNFIQNIHVEKEHVYLIYIIIYRAQVVGWPPVRSFRKNMLATQKSSGSEDSGEKAAFVKVSMDGAPYLRKVDLRMYKTYQQLSDALAKMFSSFTIGIYTHLFSIKNNLILFFMYTCFSLINCCWFT